MIPEQHYIETDSLGREVVFTRLRSARPHDSTHLPRAKKVEKSQNPANCFFCPGNEHLTPPEIARVPAGAAESGHSLRHGKNNSGWAMRCFENKFPALRPSWANAYGYHEIVVETPDHRKTVSQLDDKSWEDYYRLMASRVACHQKDRRIKYSIVFKNEGGAAGASLEHTHSQIVSMGFVPSQARKHAAFGKSLIRGWEREKKLAVYSNADFVAFCPPTSLFHLETWVAPKADLGGFGEFVDADFALFANAVKTVLYKIDRATDFAPYNIAYLLSPSQSADKNERDGFLMAAKIMPRVSNWAGFEIGCGSVMNSMPPGEAAAIIRRQKLK
ncbi:hypothetical protein FJZ26_00630 [Candidatus Parvarchaeota archaeon]|nr:hypothetical protein [Candidatus Parvarchaeota archaeon]